ncbi:MAG TPA: SsgA family sporulation/cell division regulator [Marmoricola sp.]|nr:SsgA family sporulation/cell division regulator [Marmoricola sp.]HNJ79877.1 SsgA family sporulation/cell division regulator [Marmoricola sp.]
MATIKDNKVITEAVSLEFVDAQGEIITLESDLVYDAEDPYAMTMVFKIGADDEVLWTFGRDLFISGMYEPAGDGDVRVWPCLDSTGRAVVIIELSSPEGEVMVQANSRDVSRFVSTMLTAVPRGSESSLIDFDEELVALLG